MDQRIPEYKKWLPYIAPLVAFLILTSFEQTYSSYYPIIYSIKVLVITGGLWVVRKSYPELRRDNCGVGWSIALGPVLTISWIVIDRFTPHLSILGSRSAYDPFEAIHNQTLCWLFIVLRFFGLTAIAPIIEELFYRAFLLRFVINPNDFFSVPIGTYDITSFIAVVLLMASAHPEYLAAAFFSAAMNLILYRTKNLWSTIAAHGSTNFFLGLYVLYFHAWKYW